MHSFGGVQIAFVVATMLFEFIKGAYMGVQKNSANSAFHRYTCLQEMILIV